MKIRKLTALVMACLMLLGCLPAMSDTLQPRIIIPESISVDKDAKCAVSVTFEPEDYSEAVTWSTSDPAIATVSKKGRVKGVKPGVCVITAATESGLTAQCTVTVTRPVKSIAINKTSAELGISRTMQLTATIKPKKADNQTVVWTSSNPAVASVDENGLVSGISAGRAVITAEAHNGKNAKCTVVVRNIKPTGIKMGEFFITVNPGATHTISASVKPKKASDTTLLFKSSDETVATVDENGVVTGVSVGRAVITIKAAADKSIKEKITVSVVEPGSGRMAGIIIGLNPGHQTVGITKRYPIAPGSKETAPGCKVGAAGDFTRVPEYETNLQIGLMLRDLLEAEGATVVMTRTKNNVSLTNIDRAAILNDAGVDMALQLHCNSWTNHSKHGLSVYRKTSGVYAAEEKAVAQLLADCMADTTGAKNLGVKYNDRYMSLNWSFTPSVLLEVGYLSNRREDELLATDAYRMKVAKGIYEGLAQYFGR